MGVSVRDLTGGSTGSVADVARERSVGVPFSLRELVTPQVRESAAFTRTRWSNWLADFDEERRRARPANRRELLGTVARAANGEQFGRIRAVGSGHSHSRAPDPPEHYIDLSHLRGRLSHEGWLKPTAALDVADERYLVRVRGGTVLRELNRDILAPAGLALENMGSFDGQTVAGAVSTSTHGTGIELGTLADAVRSVELVTVPESRSGDPLVRMYRIEPSDGITDRAAFEADTGEHGTTLIQDDDVFYSVVVGYGCLGVVYACTLEVREAYWLREQSDLVQWSDLKRRLRSDGVRQFAEESRHVQVLLNLPLVQDETTVTWAGEDIDPSDPVCLVRRHDVVDDPPSKPADWEHGLPDPRWPPERRKTTARDVGKALGNARHPLKPNEGWGKSLHNNFFEPEARRDPFVKNRSVTASYIALRRLRDRGNATPEPPTDAISLEVAIRPEDVVPAVEDVMRLVQDVRQTHTVDPFYRSAYEEDFDVFFAAPLGVRFTAASDHHLAPEYDRTTAMVEVPFPVVEANAQLRPNVPNLSKAEIRDDVAKPALEELEAHLVPTYDGRPHMGKHNTVDQRLLRDRYDRFAGDGGWLETYRRFNAFGTFDNAFTDQLGISRGE